MISVPYQSPCFSRHMNDREVCSVRSAFSLDDDHHRYEISASKRVTSRDNFAGQSRGTGDNRRRISSSRIASSRPCHVTSALILAFAQCVASKSSIYLPLHPPPPVRGCSLFLRRPSVERRAYSLAGSIGRTNRATRLISLLSPCFSFPSSFPLFPLSSIPSRFSSFARHSAAAYDDRGNIGDLSEISSRLSRNSARYALSSCVPSPFTYQRASESVCVHAEEDAAASLPVSLRRRDASSLLLLDIERVARLYSADS